MPAGHAQNATIAAIPASSTSAFPNNVTVAGTLAVTGAQTFTGNTVFSGTVATGALTAASAVITGAATVGTTLGVTGAATLPNIVLNIVARTATTDGLTTGTIADSGMLQYVAVTAGSDANSIIVLPSPVVGTIVILNVGATGFELRSSAPNTVAINGGTGSAGESAIAASSTVIAICVSTTAWKAIFLDADSDVAKVEAAAN